MKIFQGIATALAAAYIAVLGGIFLQMATNLADESLRVTSLWLGLFSISIVIMLVVPYIYKALNVKGKDW
ncbi:hypothetical protein BK762_19570 [Bacillus thuringiensis serovar toumanoffi]|nr:hypothetical protein BK762_19570 [Bacillus thuringiensis serovar toumanoffi]